MLTGPILPEDVDHRGGRNGGEIVEDRLVRASGVVPEDAVGDGVPEGVQNESVDLIDLRLEA